MGKWAARAAAVVLVALPAAAGEQAEIYRKLEARDDRAAAGLLERHLRRHPDDAVMLYNAACVQCRLEEPGRAADYLRKAVRAGFADVSHLRRDPDLRPLRDHPVYRAIVAARQVADPLLARRRLEEWRAKFPDDRYRYETDEQRRLLFISGLPPAAHEAMRRRVAEQVDHLRGGLFAGGQRDRLLVVLPASAEADVVLPEPRVPGVYRHHRREVIAADAGFALRHEIAHALHHAHMDALGQDHPAWIQEGLACLYEDYGLDGDGAAPRFPANDRHAAAVALARTGRLSAWPRLAALDAADLRRRAAEIYPQLRSIFRFLAGEGRLEAWYRDYVNQFEEDRSGLAALGRAFGESPAALETRWRRWLAAPGAPEPAARRRLSAP